MTHDDAPKASPVTASISGSGSSAQQGAMDAWRADFQRMYPDLRVDYRANGSGAGIRDPLARTFLTYTAGNAGQSSLALYGYAPLLPDLLAKVRAQLGTAG